MTTKNNSIEDELKDFDEKMAAQAELIKKQKALQAKELNIRDRKATFQLEQIEREEKELRNIEKTNFGKMTEDQVERIIRESEEYIRAAKNATMFVNREFDNIVPMFRKNLILIGGKTGEGKSTTVANIVSSLLQQKNPENGKRRRVLVITNEEKTEDVFNRITCLAKGWHYTNHDKFTEEQTQEFGKYIRILSKDGWLNVIDNTYNDTFGTTTSVEGIESIFNNLIRDKEYYDAIIIDYYQNIKTSKKQPDLNEYQVQAKLAAALDNFKNIYPAPIIIMAQVNPPDKEKKEPFEYRIKGRKIITDPATLIMEMVADRENLRTEWIVHKSRFTQAVGASFHTGYDRGKFVPYDSEFLKKVATYKEDREYKKIFHDVFEKEDKKEKEE